MNENIVRKHFEKFDNIIIEEQKSDNIKINKLLKHASKSGNGAGYPEFIIRFKNNFDFLIIIECKANIKYHKSNSLDKYKDYAVDGALLYASFLSKEYDVLAIGVSGESEKELKVSHYLHLKGKDKAFEVFGEKLLTPEEYLNGYKYDERKFHQDFRNLLDYSKELNVKLHNYKVEENKRALLISAILIALDDEAFYNSYKFEKEPKKLISNLLNTIELRLKQSKNKYLDDIKTSFLFLKTHTRLSKEKHLLRDLIREIDENVNSFIKTYKYIDTLGQFYIEFLRYANADKSLGIVLTPPHITEFFCDIANINKDSVVLDPCAGTGGFLISAMKKMIEDAKNDKEKETLIKEKQIIGIEFQDTIFTILASNMYIHGDGRSNLFKGNCFDEEIKQKVIKFTPNILLLNPPYKSDKKNDIEEMEFVLNGLNMLSKGGIGVAIIPLSSVIENKKEKIELKKQLLNNHTLEAVFSMPDELFYNSKVSVNTCVIVVRAKEPHPKGYKTFFGYFKDDGFTKKKTRGRDDYKNKWKNIKQKWLNTFKNKDEIEGLSVKAEINENDEWCAEEFMITDYSKLTIDIFKKKIREFLSHKVLICEIDFINKFTNNKSLTLNTSSWKTFYLTKKSNFPSLNFEITLGKPIHKNSIDEYTDLPKKDFYPYITRTTLNNGIELYIKKQKEFILQEGNCITIGAEGFKAFYQDKNFFTGNKINILRHKKLNLYNALFIAGILDFEMQNKFGYGRGAVKSRLERLKIKLPTKNNEPDWDFMEEFIKNLSYSK